MNICDLKTARSRFTEPKTIWFTPELLAEFKQLEDQHQIKITRWLRALAEEHLPELKRQLESA